jgi:hypothetical protein
MKKSKKFIVRYIEGFLKKYFATSLYPYFVFLRIGRSFKKRINIKKSFVMFSKNLPIINKNEYKKTSQNNEDGIIEYIFKIIPNEKYFVEIGFGYYEFNSFNLIKNNWSGRLIDSNTDEVLALKSSVGYYFPESEIDIVKAKVTKDNITDLVFPEKTNRDIDFFSLDIDGNDYWVLKSMNLSKIKVICCEYNHWLGANSSLTMKYNPNFNFVDNGIFGASLLAFTNILKEKGFSLIAIDSSGTNAFFIDDVYAKHFEVLCPQKNFVSVGRFYNEDKKREIFKNIKESNLLIEV